MIRGALSLAARIASRRLYRQMILERGSRVDFWKVKAKADNSIRVGANSLLASRVVYEKSGAALTIGARSFVGLGLMSIAARVDIGDDVMVSWGATIVDHNSHSLLARQRIADVELWLAGEQGLDRG